MRVISGTCKGLPLKAHKSMITRPTTDKVKESLFNIIGPYFSGGHVLDLFAGSGGLGIEALSRGADCAVFVEKSYPVSKILGQNIAFCRLTDKAEVLVKSAKQAIALLAGGDKQFDIVFLDPPYRIAADTIELMEILQTENLLAKDAVIIVEHDDQVVMPMKIKEVCQFRQEKYGETRLTFYE